MNNMPNSFKLADTHAEAFSRFIDTIEPPVNINWIRKLRPDVTIIPVKLPKGAKYKGTNRIRKDGKWDIFVNEDLPYVEQRMVVAHELYHIVFNQPMEDSRSSSLRPGDIKHLNEHAAEQFAEEFMMPEKLFKKYWKKYNQDIDRLAKTFFVPVYAVKNRVMTLGL